MMNKIICCILTISVLGLVSCSDKDQYQRQVTFSGRYLPIIQGVFKKDGFTYNVTATQATITCPSGYSISNQPPLPVFGAVYDYAMICDRQGGCEYYISILNPSGFNVEKRDISQGEVALIYNNFPTSILAACYKNNQLNDYTLVS